jgi:tRNA (Thr-GGU) A37 N-methylase
LHDPETFYANVTALELLNHLCAHLGSLHALDMVLLTIQMIQFYEGTPIIRIHPTA